MRTWSQHRGSGADPRFHGDNPESKLSEHREEQRVLLEAVTAAALGDELVAKMLELERDAASQQNVEVLERHRGDMGSMQPTQRVEAGGTGTIQSDSSQVLVHTSDSSGVRVNRRPVRYVLGAMRTFLADIQFGWRLLRRSPGFTFVAAAALAIGIGANLTIFGFAKELLLSAPPGVSDSGRVVRVFTSTFSATPLRTYERFRDVNQNFLALAAFRGETMNLRADGPPEQLFGNSVAGNYFATLGVAAAIGRTIAPSDDHPSAPAVVVLSDRWWHARFGGNRNVIGQTLTINGRPHAIVGITPSKFTGTMAPLVPDLWVPLAHSVRDANASVQIMGRLREGATINQAQAELAALAPHDESPQPDDQLPPVVSVYAARALTPELAVPAGIFALLMLVVVALVLLLACVNIANLQLARSAERTREISVRLALGASRRRLVRQLLTESLMLSLIGGAAAGVLALVVARPLAALVGSIPSPVPLALSFAVDWRLVMAAIGLAMATTLACGLVPAMQSSKADVLPALKEGAVVAPPRQSKLRAVFMTAQVALSTLLLVVAGLLVRGLMSAHTVDRGLVTDGVLMASIDLQTGGYTAERGTALYEQLRTRLEQTPGVAAVNIAELVPLMLSNNANEMVKDSSGEPATSPVLVYQNAVSPGHFRTLGIPLVAGRDFSSGDRDGSPPVAIINETLARRFWPNESPVGKRMRQRTGLETFGPWMEVIGVARDSKYVTAGEDPKPFMYESLAQAYRGSANLLVKSRFRATDALPLVHEAVRAVDPNLAIFGVASLDRATSISFLPVKIAASLSATLGVLALALGTIGLYGVMSYLVRQRTRELGIRIALGAHSGAVVSLITRQGMRWTIIGLALGLGAAFGVAKLMAGFLYGIGPTDPIAFGTITLLLAVTAFAACYVPARRASRIDPLVALRNE